MSSTAGRRLGWSPFRSRRHARELEDLAETFAREHPAVDSVAAAVQPNEPEPTEPRAPRPEPELRPVQTEFATSEAPEAPAHATEESLAAILAKIEAYQTTLEAGFTRRTADFIRPYAETVVPVVVDRPHARNARDRELAEMIYQLLIPTRAGGKWFYSPASRDAFGVPHELTVLHFDGFAGVDWEPIHRPFKTTLVSTIPMLERGHIEPARGDGDEEARDRDQLRDRPTRA